MSQKRKNLAVIDALIFIDTNVYLDFYRSTKADEMRMLNIIEQNVSNIILTEQVLMEYKKNRQAVIKTALKGITDLKIDEFNTPTFLLTSEAIKVAKKARNTIFKQVEKLQKKERIMLENPTKYDSIYQSVQRISKKPGCHFFNKKTTDDSGKEIHPEIKNLANERFTLGYPPRKNNDLKIGDAINWEWIIWCAKKLSKDIIIVTRDSDYGVKHNDKYILNDWLLHEFRDRVGVKRKLVLTDKLSVAFKRIGIKIDPKLEKAENISLDEKGVRSADLGNLKLVGSLINNNFGQTSMLKNLENLNSNTGKTLLKSLEKVKIDYSKIPTMKYIEKINANINRWTDTLNSLNKNSHLIDREEDE